MTTISHWELPAGRCLGGLVVVFSCLLAGGGCATTTYQATELPPEYVAKANERLDKADLSQLTSHSVRSNQIGIGDLIEVAVYAGYGTGETKPSLVNVTEDGTADVPLIGPVRVVGKVPDEASRAIAVAAQDRDVFRTPHVSVRMEEQRMNRIHVSGAVNTPGVVEIPRGNSNLLSAILAAGDLAENASADVTIRRPALSANTPDALRGNSQRVARSDNAVFLASYEEGLGEQARTWKVDLVSATKEGEGRFYLDDGDVVHVKKRPDREFHVDGLVKSPGVFEMPPNEDVYLINALALAGGSSMQWADSVTILRRVPGAAEPITIRASIREARKNQGNIRIQENDAVTVEETPVTMAFEIVKTFFRFSVGSSLALF
jgi:polysaccharide biosynthesis/export protein